MRQRALPHTSPARSQHPQQPAAQRRSAYPTPLGSRDRQLQPPAHSSTTPPSTVVSSWEISHEVYPATPLSHDAEALLPHGPALREPPAAGRRLGSPLLEPPGMGAPGATLLTDLYHTHSAAGAVHPDYPKRYYQNGEVYFRKTGNKRRTRLEDFHTVYRNPHHVPDRKFKQYLLGRLHPPKKAPLVTEDCLARSCLGFSAVAVAFLLFVGFLFDAQPLYIKGSLPAQYVVSSKGRTVAQYALPGARERLVPAQVSYHAAAAYALTALFCWYRLNRGRVHSWIRQRQHRYDEIPDDGGGALLPTADFLPHVVHQEGAASTTAYQIGLGSRIKASILQWLAMRGWVLRPVKFRRKREPKCV